jgi:hypothetical protein
VGAHSVEEGNNMPWVWVVAPRQAGPVAFRYGLSDILEAADSARQALAAGDWIEPEWTAIPWGDDHWVRSTTTGEEWEIVRLNMAENKADLLRNAGPGDEGVVRLVTENWLEEDAREEWLAFRVANPDAASWLPPLKS